jgi:hypothetical protein
VMSSSGSCLCTLASKTPAHAEAFEHVHDPVLVAGARARVASLDTGGGVNHEWPCHDNRLS